MAEKHHLYAGAACIALVLATAAARAEETKPRYDRKIEEAAIEQLQGKLGAFRGPIGLDPTGHIFPPIEMRDPEGRPLSRHQNDTAARITWG